jgi:hypothetical protein
MAMVMTVCLAIGVRKTRSSSSSSNWSLVVNAGGTDIISRHADLHIPFGTVRVTGLVPGDDADPRAFPPEGFARAYAFGELARVIHGDLVLRKFTLDTATLNPSSIRMETLGDDLLRSDRILLWGLDGMGAVVPLTVDADLPNLSADPDEGSGSIPLRLVDSGDDHTPLTEVLLYVCLTNSDYAATDQPTSFRIEDADGTLLRSSGLEDFSKLQTDGDHEAKIWSLVESAPFRRVDALGRAVVPKLRVDGPNNAMIKAIVAFGVNRDGARPLLVPLVHHVPAAAGTNPWVGRGSDPNGLGEMTLPLCATASRQ